MSDPRAAHPLDVDLVDFVDGSLDATQTRIISEHLDECLSCRIKRQRIAQTAPVEFTASADMAIPVFAGIDVEQVDPGSARPGELWLTAAEDASMVLITKLRANDWGVIVAPVVFDVEIADIGTLVLDEAASPIAVPISIYDAMLTSLPSTALRGRVATRPDVDLLALTEDMPGVTRGTPLEGPADPRHEIRQYINDRIRSADVPLRERPKLEVPATPAVRVIEPLDSATVDARFLELQQVFLTHEGAEVTPLAGRPLLGTAPASWEGIAQVEWFNQRVLLLLIDGGVPDDRGPVIALCKHLRSSAIAVHAHADSPVADLYSFASLVGAHDIHSGDLLTTPIRTGVASEIIEEYLTLMVDVPAISKLAISSRRPVDPKEMLGGEVTAALASQVDVGRAARIAPKTEGLTSVADLGPALTEALRLVFSTNVDPAAIADIADGSQR